MRELELPYPLLVGRVAGGSWSSAVPDRVEFEGRLGVPVGTDVADGARRARGGGRRGARRRRGAGRDRVDRRQLRARARRRPTIRGYGRGGRAGGARPGARRRAVGVPYGADMRHFTARGIPCTMAGTNGIELAHAVDERVEVAELVAVARTMVARPRADGGHEAGGRRAPARPRCWPAAAAMATARAPARGRRSRGWTPTATRPTSAR